MQKGFSLIILAIVLISLFLFVAVNSDLRFTPENKIDLCESNGGSWEIMPNGCVDSCKSQRTPGVLCTQTLTEGCNCGEGLCWDGIRCVGI